MSIFTAWQRQSTRRFIEDVEAQWFPEDVEERCGQPDVANGPIRGAEPHLTIIDEPFLASDEVSYERFAAEYRKAWPHDGQCGPEVTLPLIESGDWFSRWPVSPGEPNMGWMEVVEC